MGVTAAEAARMPASDQTWLCKVMPTPPAGDALCIFDMTRRLQGLASMGSMAGMGRMPPPGDHAAVVAALLGSMVKPKDGAAGRRPAVILLDPDFAAAFRHVEAGLAAAAVPVRMNR